MMVFPLLLMSCLGANPIGWPKAAGMADTNVHYFNGTFLAFATHDFSPENTGFLMKDWWVWSSPDLVDWSLESIVRPNVSVPWSTPGERDECWATDAAFVNNKYYFYLSVGPGTVGVVTSDHYTGPWNDPIGKPLLDGSSQKGATFRDPCVFLDDDGEYYIIAGVFDYFIAKLGKDMISLAEPLKAVTVNNPYGPCGAHTTDDKPFIHKNNGIYYLSWGCFYGMSKSVYGPYDTKGAVINTTMLAPAFRMNDSAVLEPGTTVKDLETARIQQRLQSADEGAVTAILNAAAAAAAAATPAAGDLIVLHNCSSAARTAVEWDVVPAYTPGKAFAVQLKGSKNPTLCISGSGGDGTKLKLEACGEAGSAAAKAQLVTATVHGSDGVDVALPNADCSCWNVIDNNARASGNRGVEGAIVQCYSCVDGADFNPNQRFDFTSSSAANQIRMWKGYAPGFCVGVGGASPPPPPPSPPPGPKPWFLHEDYTDRHGSFLPHQGQWYYASNDRSHSLDPTHAGVFRDTVLCYIHFRSDGTMEPCVVNQQGVGAHDVRDGPIEAEEFSKIVGSKAAKVDLRPLLQLPGAVLDNDGFAVEGLGSAGSELHFPRIAGLGSNNLASTTLRLLLASGDGRDGGGRDGGNTDVVLVARSGSGSGQVLGKCTIPYTGGIHIFRWVTCTTVQLNNAMRHRLDLVFTFEGAAAGVGAGAGAAGTHVRLDKFELLQ